MTKTPRELELEAALKDALFYVDSVAGRSPTQQANMERTLAARKISRRLHGLLNCEVSA